MGSRRAWATRSPAGASNRSYQALKWITQHPGDWVVLLGKKLITLWNAFEIPDNYHYAFMRANFLPLLWPMVTFALVAPLALVGLAMPFWRRKDVTALYLVCGFYLATVLIFYVRGRYRIPRCRSSSCLPRWRGSSDPRRDRDAALPRSRGSAPVWWCRGVDDHEYCEAATTACPPCLGGDSWFDSEWLSSRSVRDGGAFARARRYAERAFSVYAPRAQGMSRRGSGESRHGGPRSWCALAGATSPLTLRAGHKEYRTAMRLGFHQGPMQSELGTLYTIVGKPVEAVTAYRGGGSGRLCRPRGGADPRPRVRRARSLCRR